MNRLKKTTVLAAALLAAAASTQAQSSSDTIYVGLIGGANDINLNAGQAGNLYQGETWNLSSVSGIGSVTSFGALGTENSYAMWFTAASASQAGTSPGDFGGTINTFVNTVASYLHPAVNATATIAAGAVPPTPESWTEATTGSGDVASELSFSPQLATGAKAYLFSQDANGDTPNAHSYFTFNTANDVLTYGAAVPEPASFGLLAGLGVLALAIRRRIVAG
jgi:hypothetical protein